MILHCEGVEALHIGLVKEYFGNNDLRGNVFAVVIHRVSSAISRIALGEASRVGKAGWIEERVALVDSCVDVADLDSTSRIRPAASVGPGGGRIDDLMALAQI